VDLSVDGGSIYERDSIQAGTLTFSETGLMTWIGVDSSSRTFNWVYDAGMDEITVEDWQFTTALGGTTVQQTGFTFKVLESLSLIHISEPTRPY